MILVFAYHSISESTYRHAVDPESFESQIKYIVDNFDPISISQLFDLQTSEISRHKVLVTFDDGFKDNFNNAYPIIKHYGIPVTIFITTNFIGSKIPVPNYDFDALSWAEIKEMSVDNLVTFGSHTVSHPYLTGSSLNELDREFKFSKDNIENSIDEPVISIAYPKGKYNLDVVKAAERYYKLGFTCHNEPIMANSEIKPMEIPRIVISNKVAMWKFKLMFVPLFWRIKKFKVNFFRS